LKANLDDTASLIEAISGSYAVFGVTNYWERADPDYETQQGKNIADAVKVYNMEISAYKLLLMTRWFRQPEFSTSSGAHFSTSRNVS